MNSEPLSESMPRNRKGSAWRSSSSAVWTTIWLLPSTAAVSTHVVWMSVRFSECTNSPVAQAAAVDHEVDLGEAGNGHVPPIGLERDVVFEQGAGLGAAVQPLADLAAVRGQATIHLARADGQHLPLHGGP